MAISTVSLDPFILCNPETASFVTVASNLSLRALSSQTRFLSAEELLAGVQEGKVLVSKAQTCRLLVSVVLEGEDSGRSHVFAGQVARHLLNCPVGDTKSVPDHDVHESPSTQDSGVYLLNTNVAAATGPQMQEHADNIAIPSSTVKGLLEASFNALVAGQRCSVGIRVVKSMESPSLIRLAPEVFNIKYLSSLVSRSYLLPSLSSVFADLKNIESRQIRTLTENRAEGQSSGAKGDASEVIRQQLWRLTRTWLPPFQKGDFRQRGAREPAAMDDNMLSIPEACGFADDEAASENHFPVGDGPYQEVDLELDFCESYSRQNQLSEPENEQYNYDDWISFPGAMDGYPYSSLFLPTNDTIGQQGGDVDYDEACYAGFSVDHDAELDPYNSGTTSSPLSQEISPDRLEIEESHERNLKSRRLSRDSAPILPLLTDHAVAVHHYEPFSNWWSSDIDLGEEQPAAHGEIDELHEPVWASPRNEGHLQFQELSSEAGDDAGSCSWNDEGGYDGFDDTYWEPMSQAPTCLSSSSEMVEVEGGFENEWTF
ncbi:hypothetical protein CH63R_10198 [Colletotrichum higginsianum IMI 349063]|uniref:Uncharacterized protein n=2 Tax=Colletotrichum higginsianum (strain IMI 349063) TaxID=759273 RepID=A0A1B7Y236_COLHI|nr:uncharacterized protein CH63R_10198 [Colletotrichum higginsianum IMI 349063]OBR06078.1 hypothetical protein CH63R_10198 [Colletotrichum higginsianum IMI 349063]